MQILFNDKKLNEKVLNYINNNTKFFKKSLLNNEIINNEDYLLFKEYKTLNSELFNDNKEDYFWKIKNLKIFFEEYLWILKIIFWYFGNNLDKEKMKNINEKLNNIKKLYDYLFNEDRYILFTTIEWSWNFNIWYNNKIYWKILNFYIYKDINSFFKKT